MRSGNAGVRSGDTLWRCSITACQMVTATRWLLYATDDGIVRLFDTGRCVVSQYNVPPLVPPYGVPLGQHPL